MCIYISRQIDNGKTWSLTQPSGLPNNNAGTDAVSLADGRQLVVYNHVKTPIGASKGHRTPLNVAVSENGKDWFASLVLVLRERKFVII